MMKEKPVQKWVAHGPRERPGWKRKADEEVEKVDEERIERDYDERLPEPVYQEGGASSSADGQYVQVDTQGPNLEDAIDMATDQIHSIAMQ